MPLKRHLICAARCCVAAAAFPLRRVPTYARSQLGAFPLPQHCGSEWCSVALMCAVRSSRRSSRIGCVSPCSLCCDMLSRRRTSRMIGCVSPRSQPHTSPSSYHVSSARLISDRPTRPRRRPSACLAPPCLDPLAHRTCSIMVLAMCCSLAMGVANGQILLGLPAFSEAV